MYKKYKVEKLEELRKNMKEKEVFHIQSPPFSYVTGEGEEERERDCVLKYDAPLDIFTLCNLDKNLDKDEILQDDYHLVIDNELLDDLIAQLGKRQNLIEGVESDAFDLPNGCIIRPQGCEILDISEESDEVEFYIHLTFFNPDSDYSEQSHRCDIERRNISISSNEVALRYLTNNRLSLAAVHFMCRHAMKKLGLPYIDITFSDVVLTTVYPAAPEK